MLDNMWYIVYNVPHKLNEAGMVKSVDAADLKSAGAIHVGSSPTTRTKLGDMV